MRWATIACSGCSAGQLRPSLAVRVGIRAQDAGQPLERQPRHVGDVAARAKVTDSDSGRSRLPWQSGHSLLIMYCETRFFISGLCVLAKVCST